MRKLLFGVLMSLWALGAINSSCGSTGCGGWGTKTQETYDAPVTYKCGNGGKSEQRAANAAIPDCCGTLRSSGPPA